MSDLWTLSANTLASRVRTKDLTAVEVTKAHLARIDAVNPALNAIVQQFPQQALQSAEAVDAQIARGEDPGPLCGVPVTIKVNIDQKGLATTNGLKLQRDLIASEDSPVVSSIKKAGGVIVGRTNTPAFSLRWFTKNDLHGQTLNPVNKDLTPGGSSGGASSAVASGMCAIGHGTDIGGSIRYPAYACGLHGLRPTFGRVAAYNASAPDRHLGGQFMAVSGPIARTIEDIRLALAVMATEDPRDPWWVPAPLVGPSYEKKVALVKAPDGMTVDPAVTAALLDAAEKLEAEGWKVEEVVGPTLEPAAAINAKLWLSEMRRGADAMVAKENEPDSTFVFKQMTNRSAATDMNGLMDALQDRMGLVRDWQKFTQSYPVVMCPISGQLPFQQQQDVSSEQAFEDIMQAQLTQLALPALGLPGLAVATGRAGKSRNVPVGVQLIGARFREDILLDAGAAIERQGTPILPCDPT